MDFYNSLDLSVIVLAANACRKEYFHRHLLYTTQQCDYLREAVLSLSLKRIFLPGCEPISRNAVIFNQKK